MPLDTLKCVKKLLGMGEAVFTQSVRSGDLLI